MNQKGIVLSSLVYALFTFFLLLLVSFLVVLWYRQNAINSLADDANNIYDEPYVPDTEYQEDFVYTGDYQIFTVPVTGKYKIELWGASGASNGGSGGRAAYTKGEINLTGASKIYIYVGSKPADFLTAGYNGGGAGIYLNGYTRGRAGGGATDVRLVNGIWNDVNSLRSRIMVAGGGGGDTLYGGSAGGLTGITGTVVTGATSAIPGTGGTQTSGGTSGNGANGTFGVGADSAPISGTDQSGAGGGGYYGGGCGYDGDLSAGGGGGSSFISGYTGCNAIDATGTHTGQPNHYSNLIFTNSVMIDGNTSMPNPAGGTETGHVGNGYARITYLP